MSDLDQQPRPRIHARPILARLMLSTCALLAVWSAPQAQNTEPSLVSRAGGSGDAANAASTAVSMSSDGRFVLFGSQATNVVTGQVDTPGTSDVFLHDRQTGTTILVSRALEQPTTAANGNSTPRAIDSSGRYIVFDTLATNLASVSDFNSNRDVYVFDAFTESNTLVSHSGGSSINTANNSSTAFNEVAINETGGYIVFQSLATNLFPGVTDSNGREDLVLYRLGTGERTLITRSASNPNATANNQSLPLQISSTASDILFLSSASDLVNGVTDANDTFDVFLFQRADGQSHLITTASNSSTQAAAGQTISALMSSDTYWFVFNSHATNVVAGQVDTAGTDDVFLINRFSGERRLLTGVNGSPTQTLGATQTLSRRQVSRDLRYIVISTAANNLVAGVTDTNNANDLFLYDRVPGTTTVLSAAAGTPTITGNGLSGSARLSNDGEMLLFASQATDLMPGIVDNNNASDAFLLDLDSRFLRLASSAANTTNTTGNAATISIATSDSGNALLLQSSATDLIPDSTDANLGTDVIASRFVIRLFSNAFE